MSLDQKLSNLGKLFNFKTVLSNKTDTSSIARYYKINNLSYSLFHSENFIHMGISNNKIFKKKDLLEQSKIVEKYFSKKTKKVLELGTGRGANSIYLAKTHKSIEFTGVDLPKGQLQHAFRNGRDLKNFTPVEGDFHKLGKITEKSFDIVFVVEALCHSYNKEKVVKEVSKILKKDGLFITIDAFTTSKKLTNQELLAKRLVEKSMRVPDFEKYNRFINTLKKNGFKLVSAKDYSQNILPSLFRFEKDAKILISLPTFIAKILLKIFPPEFTLNAIAGYLMPNLIEDEITSYNVIVARKENRD